MKSLALVVLAGCSSTAPSGSAPIANTGVTSASPVTATVCRLEGVVIELRPGQPATGPTVVVLPGEHEQVVVTDDAGRFKIEVQPGHDKLSFYRNDATIEHRLEPRFCGQHLRVPFSLPPPPIVVY